MLLASMVAAVASLVGLGYDALRHPEISWDPIVDDSRPFAFPFSVKNESWLFEMRDADMICGLDHLKMTFPPEISGFNLDSNRHVTISPGDSGVFECALDLIIRDAKQQTDSLLEGRISTWVTYRTFWLFPRKSPASEFTWFARGSPPHWVKGKVAN